MNAERETAQNPCPRTVASASGCAGPRHQEANVLRARLDIRQLTCSVMDRILSLNRTMVDRMPTLAIILGSVPRVRLFSGTLGSILLLALLGLSEALAHSHLHCPTKPTTEWRPGECNCKSDWEPDSAQLSEIIEAHENWLKSDQTTSGRAVLCNAYIGDMSLERVNLQEADLRGVTFHETILLYAKFSNADLRGADFSGALLRGVNFKEADLRGAEFEQGRESGVRVYTNVRDTRFQEAKLQGAKFSGIDMSGASFYSAKFQDTEFYHVILNDAKLRNADLRATKFENTKLQRANLRGAKLDGRTLHEVDLQDANLRYASLTEVQFGETNLRGAELRDADLREADLEEANLKDTNLQSAKLQGADLEGANLQNADLRRANLVRANLRRSDVRDARLTDVNLSETKYEPVSLPSSDYLGGIKGIQSITFREGYQSGLGQLRNQLRKSGHRNLERQATFTIRQHEARHLRESEDLSDRLDGAAQLVFFEWTVAWGLHPGRALWIMLALMFASSAFYTIMIVNSGSGLPGQHGIFRVWPQGRLSSGRSGVVVADTDDVERLVASLPGAWAWALYFSMLSMFHIGWRDLNVGTWLARLQFKEFGLRGMGVVRLWSGVQSIVSVFLLALWALTYFGRPFQ